MTRILRQTSIRPQRIKKTLSVKEFSQKRNKILFLRRCGGLGDILMHRMMFEDVKLLDPDLKIYFACPPSHAPAIIDHPFVDHVVDSTKVHKRDFSVCYDTSTACIRAETRWAPYSKDHRSDIWSNHCGFNLTRHSMHIRLSPEEKADGKKIIEKHRNKNGPIVLFSPFGQANTSVKNLNNQQLYDTTNHLLNKGMCVLGLHTHALPLDVPTICRINVRQWMSVIDQADYVVSVDTATFHCAGGLNKPLTGIFTFSNAETYGKYYPTAELVQGPCPYGHKGCYNWGSCPVKDSLVKPCLTNISKQTIIEKLDKMFERFPICL